MFYALIIFVKKHFLGQSFSKFAIFPEKLSKNSRIISKLKGNFQKNLNIPANTLTCDCQKNVQTTSLLYSNFNIIFLIYQAYWRWNVAAKLQVQVPLDQGVHSVPWVGASVLPAANWWASWRQRKSPEPQVSWQRETHPQQTRSSSSLAGTADQNSKQRVYSIPTCWPNNSAVVELVRQKQLFSMHEKHIPATLHCNRAMCALLFKVYNHYINISYMSAFTNKLILIIITNI